MIDRHLAIRTLWTFLLAVPVAAPLLAGAVAGETVDTFTLPPGATVVLEFDVMVKAMPPAPTNTTISNQATIDPSNAAATLSDDPDAGGATDPTLTNFAGQGDLYVTKTDGSATEVPGTPVTYTVVAGNNGPRAVPDALFQDDLPAILTGCTWNSVSSGGAMGSAGAGAGDVMETLSLPDDAFVTYTITCNVDPAATGSLANTAAIGSVTIFDGTIANNMATDTDSLVPAADVSISKTDGVTSAVPGGSLTYTITVANGGPSTATAVSVSDTFPGTLDCTWMSVAAGGATGNDVGPVNADLTDGGITLPPSSSVTYSADCDIDPAATGTLSNTAMVTSGTTDPDSGDHSATDMDTVLDPTADLQITKTDGITSIQAGESLTYTIVASNPSGPSTATGVTVTDTFPTELTCTWSSVAAGGATGHDAGPAAGNILDTGITLPEGGSVTYTVDCDVDPDATGPSLMNTAMVGFGGSDPMSGNDSATDTDTLTASADVSVTKTDGVTSAVPGQGLTYTIVVTNAGPSTATGVSVSDTFPSSLDCTWTSTADAGVTGNDAGPVNADLSDGGITMPPSTSVTYTANCSIDPAATGTLSNTVMVTAATTDPDSGDLTAVDDDTVLAPSADVSITKTDGVTSAVPGQSLTYTIVASNGGPSTATGVSVSDSFPGTLDCTWTSTADAGVTGNDAGPVNADLSDGGITLPPSTAVTYTANCNIDPAATGTLSNTATVTTATSDPDTGDQTATDNDTALAPSADVSITKTDGVTMATPGQTLTYTIVVSNAGPSTATSVAVADTFPVDLSCTWTSAAAGGATGNEAGPIAGDLADTGITLPPSASVTYTALCDIDEAATGTLVNTAMASSATADPDSGDLSATDNDTVLMPSADVSVTKTDGVTAATPGASLTYTIVVSSSGPSTATSVTVADTFPVDLTCTWTSVAAGGATGNTAGPVAGPIAESGITLPSGSSVTYTALCDIDEAATGTLSNTVTVTTATSDPDTGDQTATDGDTVLQPTADLDIDKVADVTIAGPNDPVTYTITVVNNGPSTATNVEVSDALPVGVTLVSTTGCSEDPSGVPTCSLGTLASGASAQFTIDVTVDAAPPANIMNTASVSSDVTDPVPGNDSDDANVTTDVTPPQVANVDTVAGTGDGTLDECEMARVGVGEILVTFDEDVADPVGDSDPDDVTNPANYLLVEAGANRTFDTTACAGLTADDVGVAIAAVTYDSGSFTATVELSEALADGIYRFFVCGTTSITDLGGNALDGDGDGDEGPDFLRFFRVDRDNRFDNGHLDCDLAGWTEVEMAPTEIEHDPGVDFENSPESGSARVQNAPDGENLFAIVQCVDLSAATYDLDSRFRLALAPPPPGGPVSYKRSCEFWNATACGGTSLGSEVRSTLFPTTGTGGAFAVFADDMTAPVGTASASCAFSLITPSGRGFTAHLDRLRLEEQVQFEDGFETGDTSQWSSTVN